MNAVKITTEAITLEISKDELGVLTNALNEVCNGIEVLEFDTRMGIKVEGAKAILDALASIYKSADSYVRSDRES